jgi:hypothetical protein
MAGRGGAGLLPDKLGGKGKVKQAVKGGMHCICTGKVMLNHRDGFRAYMLTCLQIILRGREARGGCVCSEGEVEGR